MKTDALARARLLLRDEPSFHPPVRSATATVPAVQLLEKSQIVAVLSRTKTVLAKPASSAVQASKPAPAPPPQDVLRRVEIMMTGSLSRVGVVRRGLKQLQSQLFHELGQDRLQLRVTAFFDGCRHTTPWSHVPINAGSHTTAWHCFQGFTLFAEAFAFSCKDRYPIDAIVLFGNRFDDHLPHTLTVAKQLAARGTRIYAFHLGYGPVSRRAYELLAEQTGGAFLQLSSPRVFSDVITIITAYLLRPAEMLHAQAAPANADVREFVERLRQLPPPPALLLLPGRKTS